MKFKYLPSFTRKTCDCVPKHLYTQTWPEGKVNYSRERGTHHGMLGDWTVNIDFWRGEGKEGYRTRVGTSSNSGTCKNWWGKRKQYPVINNVAVTEDLLPLEEGLGKAPSIACRVRACVLLDTDSIGRYIFLSRKDKKKNNNPLRAGVVILKMTRVIFGTYRFVCAREVTCFSQSWQQRSWMSSVLSSAPPSQFAGSVP